MLSNEHDALPESEAFVRPVCDCGIESRMAYCDRTGCSDDPANVVGMLIPQLDAEAHVRDVVQVGIGELTKRAVDLAVKIGRRVPMQAAFPAELFQQAKRMELAVVLGGGLTHRERKENIRPRRVKREAHGDRKILEDLRRVERCRPLREISFRGARTQSGLMPEHQEAVMGNIRTTPEEKARAGYLRHVKKDKRKQRKYLPKGRSIQTTSGGLPSLGKRR